MKIKVFCPNQNGKIEFTPVELEKLLNDTYAEGQRNCNCHASGITWTNPYVAPYCSTTASNAGTNDAGTNGAGANNPTSANTFKINISNTDAKELSKKVEDFVKQFSAISNGKNDVFSNLAKELNF